MKVLLAGTHSAAAGYIAALLPVLKQRGHEVIVSLAFSAADVMARDYPGIQFIESQLTAADLLKQQSPDHLCCCVVGVPTEFEPWEMQLAREASRQRIVWSGHEEKEFTCTSDWLLPMWREMNPSRIFVTEEGSALSLTACGVNESLIQVTGSPVWDNLVEFDKEGVRKAVRGQLGLDDNSKLVVWIASKTSKVVEQDWLLIRRKLNQLNGSRRIILAVYFHPGCPDWRHTATVENPHGCYHSIVTECDFAVLPGLDLFEQGIQQRHVLAAADLLISFGSTMTLDAVFLGIPTVRPFTSGNFERVSGQRFPDRDLFSLVRHGCQIPLRQEADWAVLDRLLNPNDEWRRSLITNGLLFYPLSSGRGELIVKEIEKLH